MRSLIIDIDEPQEAIRMRRQLAAAPDEKFVNLEWDNITIRGRARELKRIIQFRG